MMTSHRSRESTEFFGSVVDPKNAKDLQRTKEDIENNITKILKLVKNESHSAKYGNGKDSTKKTELVGLIEDLQKQQHSLYALFGRVIGESGKVVHQRRNKRASVPSSDSDSEYFSSEEVEANKRRSEREQHQNVSDAENKKSDDTNEVLKAEAKKLEEQLASLMEEMESLNQKKRNLEVEVESQRNEITQLSARNNALHEQFSKLELKLKEENGVVSDLRTKLSNNESKANSRIANLMSMINKLKVETESMRTQKNEMEEKLKNDEKEASTKIEELMEKVNVMQQKLNLACIQNNESEAEMATKREQISEQLIEIQSLNESLSEMRTSEENMAEEKDSFVQRIKELEIEVENRRIQKNELEVQLNNTSYEMKQLKDENKALQDRNHDLRTAVTQKGEEISDFLKKHNENSASVEAITLKAQVNAMRLEIDSLQEQKDKLDQQNERSQKENAEQETAMERVREENKQVKAMCNKLRLNQRLAERKMEELAQEFKKKMEDYIRLLHQRIHVAEQLNNENKNSCKKTKQRFEEENKELKERVVRYEKELMALKEEGGAETDADVIMPSHNGFDLETVELVVRKVEEQREFVMRRVSKMKCEIGGVKDWVKRRNAEVALLREKLWDLEAEVSKGGGERLNLMRQVSQLEKKVAKLENTVKEKDEELLSLGDKKREAIRQLCFVVDFHRQQSNYLKDLLLAAKRTLNNPKS